MAASPSLLVLVAVCVLAACLRRRLAAGRARAHRPTGRNSATPYTLRGYVDRGRADERRPDGLGGVVGARPRLRALRRSSRRGCRARGSSARSAAAGCGRSRSRPGSARRRRRAPTRRSRSRSRCSRRARASLRDGVPVRVDEPRLRARARAVALPRLAVHARRVRRRHRADRADVAALCASRLAAARGGGARARAARRRRPRAPDGRRPRLPLARAAGSLQAWSDVAHNFRGDWQMLWKEIVGGFVIAGYVALLPKGFFNGLFLTDRPAPLRVVENVARRAGRRRARVRLLDREHAARRRALGRRHLVRRRDRVHLRRPDRRCRSSLIYRKYYGARGRGAARRRDVRRDGGRRARRRRHLLARSASCRRTARRSRRSPSGRSAWNYTSLLDIVFAVGLRRADRADAPSRREGSGLRDDGRSSRGRPDVGARRAHRLLLRRTASAPSTPTRRPTHDATATSAPTRRTR